MRVKMVNEEPEWQKYWEFGMSLISNHTFIKKEQKEEQENVRKKL